MGTRVIHWSFKTITELEILWTFAVELSSPAVASRLKVLQKSCFGHPKNTTSDLMAILSVNKTWITLKILLFSWASWFFFLSFFIAGLGRWFEPPFFPTNQTITKCSNPLSWICGQPGFAPAGRPSDARWPPPGKVPQNISNAAMLNSCSLKLNSFTLTQRQLFMWQNCSWRYQFPILILAFSKDIGAKQNVLHNIGCGSSWSAQWLRKISCTKSQSQVLTAACSPCILIVSGNIRYAPQLRKTLSLLYL